jgi:hypothetical protein
MAEREHWLAQGVPAAKLLLLPEIAPTTAAAPKPGAASTPFGGAIALGPRDLPGQHLAMTLALQGSGVALTLAGPMGHPFGDWHLVRLGGTELRLAPAPDEDGTLAALRRSAVLLHLHDSPPSYALPLQAAAVGCELVLAESGDARSLFGQHASYVDPCDLPGLRAAVIAALQRWPQGSAENWRRTLAATHSTAAAGQCLLVGYGLGTANTLAAGMPATCA